MGIDYSLIRFLPDFEEAKKVTNIANWTDPDYSTVTLWPDEHYSVITNIPSGIDFDNDYKVEIINLCGVVLLDITANTTIFEFVDKFGVSQAVIEIINIGQVFGDSVCLKLTHVTGEEILYSNPFRIVEDENTIRIAYKSYGYFQGADYTNAPYFQILRISGSLGSNDDITESEEYRETTGRVYASQGIIQTTQKLSIENTHKLAFEGLVRAFKSDEVYVEGKRVTNRPVLKGSDRMGTTFNFSAEVVLVFDDTDVFDDSYQVTTTFTYTKLSPAGYFTLDAIEDEVIQIGFNKDVTIGTGNLYVYKSNGELTGTLTQDDFILDGTDSVVTVTTIGDLIDGNNSYYIQFDPGLFVSDLGQTTSISSQTSWNFTIANGDWLAEDFSATDWLIYTS